MSPLPSLRLAAALRSAALRSTLLAVTLLSTGCVMLTGDFELLDQACAEPYSCSSSGELRGCSMTGGERVQTPLEACGAPHLCDPSLGRCLTCVAVSQRRCSDTVLERCNDDGTGWQTVEDCADDGLLCAEETSDDVVVARCATCKQDESVCDEAKAAVLECTRTNRGWGFHEQRQCSQLGCLERVTGQGLRHAWCQECTEPNGTYCVMRGDAPSDTRQVCTEDLTLEPLKCDSGEVCVTLSDDAAACVAMED